MHAQNKIGIIAPSSVVPKVELQIGVRRLEGVGFKVLVNPQCKSRHLFFAGTDEKRAEAFFDFAIDPAIDVLWCARGGYGSVRLLPLLEHFTHERGVPPKKLLVGFSDATALMEFVRSRWGWSILHAPMPAQKVFHSMSGKEWDSLVECIRGGAFSVGSWPLKYYGTLPVHHIQAPLLGGNLAVITSLCGSSFAGNFDGKILFLEDVDEHFYRIDRMMQQLLISGALQGVRAIVLGQFSDCKDVVPKISGRALLRPVLSHSKAMKEIFTPIAERVGVCIFYGLPVGHGSVSAPLPLGAEYRITNDAKLSLVHWDWLS